MKASTLVLEKYWKIVVNCEALFTNTVTSTPRQACFGRLAVEKHHTRHGCGVRPSRTCTFASQYRGANGPARASQTVAQNSLASEWKYVLLKDRQQQDRRQPRHWSDSA